MLPLIKWPGGKRKLIPHIRPLIPSRFNQYFEPFLGGAALFFFLRPLKAHLSDKNADLIQAYVQVRDRPEAVIRALSGFKNSERDYYRIRADKPRTTAARAARVLYLTTLSFNGIFRVNLEGRFNVPYGRKTHLQPWDPPRIRGASRVLKETDLRALDFEPALTDAGNGDLVYLDPPYTVAHGNNGFLKYNAKIFSWDDQIRLARVAREIAKRGATVIVSNADHHSIRRLYKDFDSITIERVSIIAAESRFRSRITECLFYARGKH
jgi:DNA adenine methylase